MKTPLLFLLLASLGAASLQGANEKILIDLTEVHIDHINNTTEKNWEFAYQEWDKKIVNMPGKGALIQAPSGKGGFGENRTMVRFGKSSAIEIVMLIGNANKAQNLRFSLEDKDGTIQNFTIPLSTMPKGAALRYKIDLQQPAAETEKPGKTPGLDLNKIFGWQIKGDWQDAPVEVLLVMVVAAAKS